MRILIVEDNELIVKSLTALLHYQSYAVEVATNGQVAWDLVQAFNYDLILLDIMLPGLDGISLCRQLRSHGSKVPILLLTGRDSGHDKAMGLDAGADDYVVKPFDSKELVARIRALLRRNSSTLSPILEWGKLRLDPSNLEVRYETQPIQLTSKEYALLELLMRYPKRVFSCDVILEHIWSFENTPTEEAVRTQIKGLRQKLKAVGAAADLIETVYGIGYRLKALPTKPISNISLKGESKQQQQTSSALTEVQSRFKKRINQHIAVLEQAATAYLQETLNQELRTLAEREAQILVGSLSHYGLNKGAQLARTIKHHLQLSQPSTKEAKYLHKLVMALRKEIESSSQGAVSKLANSKDGRPKLLVVDSDRQLARELVIRAEAQGIIAEVATTLFEVRDKIDCVRPDAVLLDPIVGNTTEESFALLAELLLQTPPVPVVVFTAHSNLDARLKVARLGGRTFLQKPIPANDVIQVVTHILQPTNVGSEAVVMVADNNPQTPATLRALIEPWGLKAIVENDPQQFWETLEASAPDLLIVNLDMPNLNGIELCQVVRNDVRWGGLPILFLAKNIDTTTIHQIFAAGADDFVSNPIVGSELVTRILHRLERTKLQQSLAEIDPLTRVYNRYRATQDLNKLLRLSLRHNQPMCLAILELDHFKQINSDFGHASGDAVLRQLGQLLQQSFRGEDVVSRWGAEEFVVGMYGMTRSHGLQRVVQILETLHEHEFIASNNSKFQVTASAGIAQYSEDGDDLQSLYKSANIALDRAKATGCNCVLPALIEN
ncbi:transcriptional regulator [Scytonema hofmannii PCC 7110]|uniref:Transcriptional regulator n=1 Tax=Scytonema hofmannii PCC 7110 TaxID=128403 RepID=A0A139WXB7_9CYAN|nr:response regulator [Scytonema hofmannii]KYC37081.1 transcriptional regulator [Scytonema hofmannii PCC 7110]